MSVRISYDQKQFARVTGLLSTRAANIAACKAIDAVTARAVVEGRDEIQAVFDNPSAFTLRAMTRTTTKGGVPKAFVGINYNNRYLTPQVKGGKRERKKSESLLYKVLSPNRYYVPVNPEKIRRAELVRIISFLQSAGDAANNTTDKSKKKNRYLKKVQYMVDKSGGKSRIYAMDNAGGRWRRLVYSAAAQPKYQRRLDIQGVVDAVMYTRFGPAFQQAFLEYQEGHAK